MYVSILFGGNQRLPLRHLRTLANLENPFSFSSMIFRSEPAMKTCLVALKLSVLRWDSLLPRGSHFSFLTQRAVWWRPIDPKFSNLFGVCMFPQILPRFKQPFCWKLRFARKNFDWFLWFDLRRGNKMKCEPRGENESHRQNWVVSKRPKKFLFTALRRENIEENVEGFSKLVRLRRIKTVAVFSVGF